MADRYPQFIASKALRSEARGIAPAPVHPSLYDFQSAIVGWAIRRGSACVFSGCGTGKTRMQLEWARQMGKRVLIAAPLCVSGQTIAEAAEMGLDVRYATHQPSEPGIWITNYERLEAFDPAQWDAFVAEESSILKSIDGKTRTRILEQWTAVPYRLACSATPAPNDVVELANHAEFMGVMSRPEFLATWFVHDNDVSGHGGWRLKGHAETAFWEWVASWAVYIRMPSDLGFPDAGFQLPPLTIQGLSVQSDYTPDGMLFSVGMTGGIRGRHEARRKTLGARVAECVDLVRKTDGQWLIWCGLNAEQDAIAKELAGEIASIDGATPEAKRIELEQRWRSGELRILTSKVEMFGHGMNWQHCHQMAFLGLGDSFEQYYQAIRRCWRFGQKRPVDVWIVTSEAEMDVVRNVQRKEADSETLAARIAGCMREFGVAAVRGSERVQSNYQPQVAMRLPRFLS